MTERNVALLPVPYMSQLGPGAEEFRNDCGAASGAMLVQAYTGESITPNEFYRSTEQTEDAYLSAWQVAKVLTAKGIRTTWQLGMNLPELFSALAAGKPLIVLFNYGALRERVNTENGSFSGGHFAVAVGIDTLNVYLHDPLWSGDGGKALAVPHEDWMYAWDAARREDNPACAALVPVIGISEFSGSNELYSVRVVADGGLRIRSAPRVAQGTDTGRFLTRDEVVKIWEERRSDGDLWGAITVDKTRWVAVEYQGDTLAERV
jgi:uncharacterized protein YvpB